MKIRIKYLTDIKPLELNPKGDFIDLMAAEDTFIREGEYKLIPLGVAMELPEGYEAHVVPRSSTFKNYGVFMTNSIGIIDHSYCGNGDQWHFPAYCLKGRDVVNGVRGSVIKKGERICQFRLVENQPKVVFEEVEDLGNADRKGFGSTGR